MPNRIIWEKCRTSPTLANISADAERLFWRLMTTADDFGRFEGETDVIRAACFPKQLDQYSHKKVDQFLAELVQEGAVALYTANGRRYGHFLQWGEYQRTRAEKSKYPEPTSDNACQQVTSADDKCGRIRIRIRSSNRYTNNGASHFDKFWSVYPKKQAKQKALRAWLKLKPDDALLGVILASLDAAMTSENWLKDKGQWIPNPATWLNDKRWEDVLENSVSEAERKKREILNASS